MCGEVSRVGELLLVRTGGIDNNRKDSGIDTATI